MTRPNSTKRSRPANRTLEEISKCTLNGDTPHTIEEMKRCGCVDCRWMLACSGYTDASSRVDTLTDRERFVLRMIGTGASTKEIGSRMGITYKTADTYRENLRHKLGFRHAQHMQVFATMLLYHEMREGVEVGPINN